MAKKVVGLIVGLVLVVGVPSCVYLLVNNELKLGYNQGYMPEQPLPFSHEVHAGQNKIACQYCHTTTETSRHASIPSLNICMNCHQSVKLDSPWIQKLQQAYMEGESIPWQKVHLLPDHVKFNHMAHITAGKQCTDCHGAVETMKEVYQKEDLSMGWCVNCHRKPENNAPVNCATCHY